MMLECRQLELCDFKRTGARHTKITRTHTDTSVVHSCGNSVFILYFQVRNEQGQEGLVPAIVLLIPPPDRQVVQEGQR